MLKINTNPDNIQEHSDFVKYLKDPNNDVMSELANAGFFPAEFIKQGARNYAYYEVFAEGIEYIMPRTFEPEREFFEDNIWKYHYTDRVNTVLVYFQYADTIFEDNTVEISITGPKAPKLDNLRKMKRRIRDKAAKANAAIQKVRDIYYETPAGIEKTFLKEMEETATNIVDHVSGKGYNILHYTEEGDGSSFVMQKNNTHELLRFNCKFVNHKALFTNEPTMSYFAEETEIAVILEREIVPFLSIYNKLIDIVHEVRMDAMADKIAGPNKVPF